MNQIRDFYQKHYGEPDRQASFTSPEGRFVDVLKWSPEKTAEEVVMYATCGASCSPMQSAQGCEFFVGLASEVDSIVDALAEVALHGSGREGVPEEGDTITLAFSLWQGTDAKSFLFTDGSEILPPMAAGHRNIRFIQLVPIFESELEFKKARGHEALWDAFESLEVPYWDPFRKAAF